MSRAICLPLAFLLVIAPACSRKEPAAATKNADKIEGVVTLPPVAPPTKTPEAPVDPPKTDDALPPPVFAAPDPNNEKYEAALSEGLNELANQDLDKALAAFQKAQEFKDSDFIKGEIAKLKTRIDADAAANKTVVEIQAVLNGGDAREAKRLAGEALKEFGAGPAALKLLQIQAQADALLGVDAKVDAKEQFAKFRDAGNVALQDQNLRVAIFNFQQALQLAADDALRDQLKDIQERVDKYDLFRKRANDLRKDPTQLDVALESLKEAAKAWNTPEIRQDLDDVALALQKRRDTVSVADFDTPENFGVPDAGAAIADDLLPNFKVRFDLVDRGQVKKAVDDLKLPVPPQNADQQREVGKLARVRYLVVGSVHRFGDVVVNARLIDTASGLVVQTGRVSAPTYEQLAPKLPELAKQLLMTDAEKLAFDQQQLKAAKAMQPIAANAPLPPAPVIGGPAPAGPWGADIAPPVLGALQLAQFRALQPQPVAFQQIIVVEPAPVAFRSRLLTASVLLGDNYFARGYYWSAYRQYEFALTLSPNDFIIRGRLDMCRPLLPPAAIQPAVLMRPRVAVMNFFVVGNPLVVPPALSVAAPGWLTPYFIGKYEIADPFEVSWMMGALGISQYDLLNDPAARFWLGRSLNIQYFLMGTIEQTASFNTSTYMLNAERGWLQGSGMIHAHSPEEFKMRAGELAHMTQLAPAARPAFVANEPQINVLINRGQQCLGRNDYKGAVTSFESALTLRAGNIQVLFLLTQARESMRRHELEQARQQDIARQQAAANLAKQRQIDLAQAAEAARIRAAKDAAARADAERAGLAQQRTNAYADMVNRARAARDQKNYALSVSLYQGALDLTPAPPPQSPPLVLPIPRDDVAKELAHAKLEIARANEGKLAAEKVASHEAEVRRQREKELEIARQRLEADHKKAETDALLQKQATDLKYQAAFDQGQLLISQGKYEAAIVALQGARQYKKTDAVEALLHTAVTRQAESVAHAKGAAERKLLEEKLAAEKKRKDEAKKAHDDYDAALVLAKEALGKKQYDVAVIQFQTAGKLFQTDAVRAGLKQVETARLQDQAAQAEAERLKSYQDKLAAGQFQLAKKDYLAAIASFNEALKFKANDPIASAGLSQAQKEANAAATQVRTQEEYQSLMKSGQAALAKKQWNDAIKSFDAAHRLVPGDKASLDLLESARRSRQVEEDSSSVQAAEQKKKTTYAAAMQSGQQLFSQKKYPEAVQAFQGAKSLYPQDPAANQALAQATQAWEQAKTPIPIKKDPPKDDPAKAKAAADKAQYDALMAKGVQLLQARQFAPAAQQFEAALRIVPNDPQATKMLQAARNAKK